MSKSSRTSKGVSHQRSWADDPTDPKHLQCTIEGPYLRGEGSTTQNRDNKGVRLKADKPLGKRIPEHWATRGFNLLDQNQIANSQKEITMHIA